MKRNFTELTLTFLSTYILFHKNELGLKKIRLESCRRIANSGGHIVNAYNHIFQQWNVKKGPVFGSYFLLWGACFPAKPIRTSGCKQWHLCIATASWPRDLERFSVRDRKLEEKKSRKFNDADQKAAKHIQEKSAKGNKARIRFAIENSARFWGAARSWLDHHPRGKTVFIGSKGLLVLSMHKSHWSSD